MGAGMADKPVPGFLFYRGSNGGNPHAPFTVAELRSLADNTAPQELRDRTIIWCDSLVKPHQE
jgi:hypothetical protein